VVGCRAARSPPFCGEVGVDPLAEPALLLAPAQALGQEDLVDAAPPDADPLGVEVVLQAVQRPGGEGQAQLPRVGQGGGQDLGDLLGRVGGRAAGAGHVLQAGEALEVVAADPGVDGRARDAQLTGDGGGLQAARGGLDDAGALDGAGRRGAGSGQVLDGLAFLGGQCAEDDLGGHGAPRSRDDRLTRRDFAANLLPDEPMWCIRLVQLQRRLGHRA
jgi:hypothetical protein